MTDDSLPSSSNEPAGGASSDFKTFTGLWLLVVALWARLFWGLRWEWEVDPQYAYGWFIPILGGILWFGRWKDRPKPEKPKYAGAVFAASLFLLLPLLPLELLAAVYPEARPFQWLQASIATTVTLVAIWQVGGRPWLRHFVYPVLFLLLAVPWARDFQNHVTNTLMHGVASVSVELMLLAGIPATQEGNTIALMNQVVGVDEACSGIRSLLGSIMVGLFLGEFYRLSRWRRTLLLAISIAVSLFLNVIRAATLTWICATYGERVLERFHDPAGLTILVVVFVFSISLAALFARRSGFGSPAPIGSHIPPAPLSLRMRRLCWIGLGWLLVIEISSHAYFYDPVSASAKTWTLDFTKISGTVTEENISPTARQFLRFNTGRAMAVDLPDGNSLRIIDLQWAGGEISAAGARTHSPMICLPALGYELKESLPVLALQVGPWPCAFDAAIFQVKGRTAYVYHGLWESGHVVTGENSGDQSLRSAFSAIAARRRLADAHVLLVLLMGPRDGDEARRVLEGFLAQTMVARNAS